MVLGYGGKQVRDNIHSFDLVNAFWHFFEAPRSGEVYNIGGGRYCNCSILEAIDKCQNLTARKMRWSYSERNRTGDHIWWISDIRRFQTHYPWWSMRYDLDAIMHEIFDAVGERASRLGVVCVCDNFNRNDGVLFYWIFLTILVSACRLGTGFCNGGEVRRNEFGRHWCRHGAGLS